MIHSILKPLTFFLGASALFFSGCATLRTDRPSRRPGPPPQREMPMSYEEAMRPAVPEAVRPVPAPVPAPVIAEPLPEPVVPVVTPPPPAPREGMPYTVRRGDSLSAIAARHGMSWRQLADYNRISDPNTIRVGQVILIPGDGSPAQAPASAPRSTAVAGSETYVVQPGDNLTLIARRHNTTVRDLKTVNDLSTDTIRVGQRLKLPAGSGGAGARPEANRPVQESAPRSAPRAEPVPAPAERAPAAPRAAEAPVPAPEPAAEPAPPADDRAFEIQVEEGDTLESISQSYWIPVEALRRENNLGANAEVRPGQTLRIPPTTW